MNFKVEIYSNNDSVDSPEELANALVEVAASIRAMKALPRTENPKTYTFVPGSGLVRAAYKVLPVDLAMGLDP
jgi:hypothetical protein